MTKNVCNNGGVEQEMIASKCMRCIDNSKAGKKCGAPERGHQSSLMNGKKTSVQYSIATGVWNI